MQDLNYETVVTNIRQIIQEKGMKQGVVAERSGLTESDFSNMLNKRRKLIRIEHIPLIAHSLGIPIDELFETEREDRKGGK